MRGGSPAPGSNGGNLPRRGLTLLVLGILSSPIPGAPQVPRSYDALWAEEALVLDGRLTDAAWETAPWSEPFVDIRGEEWPAPSLSTRMKILWDAEYLYICAEIVEPHMWATLRTPDAIIYQEDDFEIFLDPNGEGLKYFEIEINALGTILDLYLDRPYTRGGRANIQWGSPGLKAEVHIQGTVNDPSDRDWGWTVEMAIPWRDLRPPGQPSGASGPLPPSGSAWDPGSPPGPGDTWRMNFSRVDWPLDILRDGSTGRLTYRRARDPSRDNPHPENNWVWSPQGAIDMHIPERWGRVRFRGPPAATPSNPWRGP